MNIIRVTFESENASFTAYYDILFVNFKVGDKVSVFNPFIKKREMYTVVSKKHI